MSSNITVSRFLNAIVLVSVNAGLILLVTVSVIVALAPSANPVGFNIPFSNNSASIYVSLDTV